MNEKPTISKADIAKGYDAIVDKVLMHDEYYENCIAMHPKHEGAILDIGCGQGLLLQKIGRRAHGKATLCGIDISPKLCAIARQNNPTATIGLGDAEALTFADNSFDIIFMTEVLEHMLDYGKALSEVHRVLKPGGTFIVSVPNRDWASYDFYDKIRNHSMQPVDDHYFRYAEISGLLREHSLRIVKYRGLDNLFYYGWKHKLEDIAAFFLPFLHRKMKRLLFKCINEK